MKRYICAPCFAPVFKIIGFEDYIGAESEKANLLGTDESSDEEFETQEVNDSNENKVCLY